MTGNNSMELNEATMIEIAQYWLDNKLLNHDNPSPKVVSVKVTNQNGCLTFSVGLNSEAAQKAA